MLLSSSPQQVHTAQHMCSLVKKDYPFTDLRTPFSKFLLKLSDMSDYVKLVAC